MTSWRARVALGVVVVLVLAGFLWWAFTRGDDPLDDPITGPTAPSGTLARGDEELPFDDPIEEPTLEEDPGDPPPDDGFADAEVVQRWPMVSDAAIADADQSFELPLGGAGRMLVLVDCDSAAFGTGIAVAVVGVAPELDLVGLLSPEAKARPALVTDAAGNGFKVTPVELPEPSYTLTFDTLGNASVTFAGCPEPT